MAETFQDDRNQQQENVFEQFSEQWSPYPHNQVVPHLEPLGGGNFDASNEPMGRDQAGSWGKAHTVSTSQRSSGPSIGSADASLPEFESLFHDFQAAGGNLLSLENGTQAISAPALTESSNAPSEASIFSWIPGAPSFESLQPSSVADATLEMASVPPPDFRYAAQEAVEQLDESHLPDGDTLKNNSGSNRLQLPLRCQHCSKEFTEKHKYK